MYVAYNAHTLYAFFSTDNSRTDNSMEIYHNVVSKEEEEAEVIIGNLKVHKQSDRLNQIFVTNFNKTSHYS